MRQILFLFFLWFHWLSIASAEMKRVAVLEFTGLGVDPVALAVISDSARAGIVQAVDTDQVLVMTRESILEVLKDMGKDASCLEGSCEVETGRNIGADYILTGRVARFDGEYVLTLKFLDTRTGALLSSETLDSPELGSLRKATSGLVQRVVVDALHLEPIAERDDEVKVNSPSAEPLYKVVLIPKGNFIMGCTDGQGRLCQRDEQPSVAVEISRDFYMMETEVTQRLYRKIMDSNPSAITARRPSFPVTRIKWREAAEFANALSREEGLETCYVITRLRVEWRSSDCQGWRLPTEAEWEYAARAGTDQKYAGSRWFAKVSHGGIFTSVPTNGCTKQKNDYGLCDMSGNVQEWTWDSYKSRMYRVYAAEDGVRDPKGALIGLGHVIRGGGIQINRFRSRISRRWYSLSLIRSSRVGFRLVRSVPESK